MEYNMHGSVALAAATVAAAPWRSRPLPRPRGGGLPLAVAAWRPRLQIAIAVATATWRVASRPVLVDGWLPEGPVAAGSTWATKGCPKRDC